MLAMADAERGRVAGVIVSNIVSKGWSFKSRATQPPRFVVIVMHGFAGTAVLILGWIGYIGYTIQIVVAVISHKRIGRPARQGQGLRCNAPFAVGVRVGFSADA